MPPPPDPSARAPPTEASPSGSAAVGGGRAEKEGLRRLQQFVGIGQEKVELTEDELRPNDQRQDDEICALESIFGGNVVMFSRKDGQRWSFQVHVHIGIPDGTDVSTRLSFGAGTLNYKEPHDA